MANEGLSTSKFSVYDAVTHKIVKAIEAGAGRSKMPWHTDGIPIGLPTNARTNGEYRGVNVLTLWIDALVKGYQSGTWATYKQWQEIGAQVHRGQAGTMIVFYKQLETTPLEDEDPDQRTGRRYFAKTSWVFNEAQVDGYIALEPERPFSAFERCEQAEALLGAIPATVKHGFPMARYRHDDDLIEMPDREQFIDTPTSSASESYYAVRFHETVHWSGAEHRLNRVFGKRFGDHAYAMEELVAELGSAFLCASLGISTEPRADHAAYVANWLAVLKSDNRAIFTAASAAQEAFEYLFFLAEKNEPGDRSTATGTND